MATMNVSLPAQMKIWVEEQTKTGRYSNASDYIRDLIRRDQDHQKPVLAREAAVESTAPNEDAADTNARPTKKPYRRSGTLKLGPRSE